MAPPQRAESPTVHIPDLASAPTLSAEAEAIVAAMGQGLIGPDAVAMLLSAIADAAKIYEVDQLKRTVEDLQRQLAGHTA